MKARVFQLTKALAQLPFGLFPGIGFRGADHLGQIQPRHAGGVLRGSDGGGDAFGGDLLTCGQAHNGTVLRSFFTQHARQPAGVNIGNGHRALAGQKFRQTLLGTEIADGQGQIANDQSSGLHLGSFHVLRIDTVAANVRIGQSDDLLAIAGVGEDFLIAGHGGVKHHFSDGSPCATDGVANKDRAVCERQDGGRERSLKRQKHWVLRVDFGYAQRVLDNLELCGSLQQKWPKNDARRKVG